MSGMVSDEVLGEFLSECEEIIQRVSSAFSIIEKNEHDFELLDAVYRDMHTLKGSSYLFGFTNIGQLAHVMETCLDPLRQKDTHYTVSSEFLAILDESLGIFEHIMGRLAENQGDKGFESEVGKAFHKLIDRATRNYGRDFQLVNNGVYPDEDLAKISLESRKHLNSSEEEVSEELPVLEEVEMENQIMEKPTSVEASTVAAEQPQATEDGAAKSSTTQGSFAGESVRVHVDLLDRLMNLTGELVLVRNQVLQFSNKSENLDLLNLSQSLNIVTADLQEGVMKTRMQPVGAVLNKFQRVVRDLARSIDKKIDITISGAETELDKTLLEAIKDPLTHIIRNSCDHGIETPAERKAAGKSDTGHVAIRAYHEGGQVVIEINDDGRGLSREKLIAKGLKNGLITESQAESMGDREVYQLIFMPGFSTAEKVSSVSGRGVGMDVVKTNIEKIGGNVELNSKLGKGTSLRLKIPLTLAIVPAMLVRCGEERYAIPQVKLVELVRVENDVESNSKIEFLHGKPVYRLRGNLLPLVSLNEALGEKNEGESIEERYKKGSINLVVLNAEGHYFGLIVDEILDAADIVVKPLSQFLKSISVFSGATIMGDGSVALILDVMGISGHATMEGPKKSGKLANVIKGGATEAPFSDSMEFLLFDLNANGKYAMPLCLVNRLEEFPRSAIEHSGDQRVVRYRGAILPIVSLCDTLGIENDSPAGDSITVIVTAKKDRLFGIEVRKILDVMVVNQLVDDSVKDREGILGNIVLDKEVVVVADILNIMDREIAKLSQGKVTSETEDNAGKVQEVGAFEPQNINILFAEDTAFFRKQVVKTLTKHGYNVVTAVDGQEALDMVNKSERSQFDLILSDIEMPNLTGYELAEKVRTTDHFSDIPMIALTTRFKQRDIERGKEAGFTLYLEKLNEEILINALNGIFQEKRSA